MSEPQPGCRGPKKELEKKIMFDYKQLKPDPNSSEEYQFEEVRARIYMERYRMQEEMEAKYNSELQAKSHEIQELKRKYRIIFLK
jgi:NAD+--asparagine ADP-ribosyltransferase